MMNRYDIKNVASGDITHSYKASKPMEHHSEWGMLAWDEQCPVFDLDGMPVLDENGMATFTTVNHPATYEVIITDITLETALAECRTKRSSEYPPVTDFADAMVHAQMGDSTKLAEYYAACEAVKAKYPKPQ